MVVRLSASASTSGPCTRPRVSQLRPDENLCAQNSRAGQLSAGQEYLLMNYFNFEKYTGFVYCGGGQLIGTSN